MSGQHAGAETMKLTNELTRVAATLDCTATVNAEGRIVITHECGATFATVRSETQALDKLRGHEVCANCWPEGI